MRKYLFCCVFIIGFLSCKKESAMISPSGDIVLHITTDAEQTLRYYVEYKGTTIIEPSALGLVRNDADFTKLTIADISDKEEIRYTYNAPSGKKQLSTYWGNQWHLKVKNPNGNEMTISFYLTNGGVAYRYSFDETSTDNKTIIKEISSFKFPPDAKAWLHPHDDVKTGWARTNPSYEANYKMDTPVGTPAPHKAGWSYPALFLSSDSVWVLISEAGLDAPYCGTRLAQESPNGEYSVSFPEQGESLYDNMPVTPIAKTPFKSPWRVIMLGGLNDILTNTLVTDLEEPSVLADIEYVKPGIASWSWAIEKDKSCNFNRQKEYIDYAANMNWEYTLIDAGWDKQIGYSKMQALIDYAKSKNVGIFLWYNSAGSWNDTPQTPRDILNDEKWRNIELGKISGMGIKGIKVDFFPGDSPSSIEYYQSILQSAAYYNLMVIFHGSTIPRGWERKYPNLMSMEAVKGFEFITFSQENANKAAAHCTLLPFTRNVVGAMDFTPVCLGEIPNIERKTSNGFELALSVLFQSGIQHIVTPPEVMYKQPQYVQDLLKNIPRGWDEVRLMEGYPGKYIVVAKLKGMKWYIAGINAENTTKELTLDFSDYYIETKGTMICNDSMSNIWTQEKVEMSVDLTDMSNIRLPIRKLKTKIKPNSGFVMEFDTYYPFPIE